MTGYTTAVGGQYEPDWPQSASASVTINRNVGGDAYAWKSKHQYLEGAVIAMVLGDNQYSAIVTVGGRSSDVEPDWSSLMSAIDDGNGTPATVTDGGVTWQSLQREDIVLEAIPPMQSGANEPVWPAYDGDNVTDGSVQWVANDFSIPQAPDSGVAAVQSHKIFSGTDFSATDNPTDWESEGDAGFLPMADNFSGASEVTALAEYRGGLVAFSRDGYELWKTDPDPENMALINVGAIGTQYPYAIVQAGNDLYFVASAGVRSFALQSITNNLADSDIGSPVDELVKQALANGLNGTDVQVVYDDVTGACVWAISDRYNPEANTRLFSLFLAPVEKVKAWGVSDLPYHVDYLCALDGLYLMDGTDIYAATPLDSTGAHQAADEVES